MISPHFKAIFQRFSPCVLRYSTNRGIEDTGSIISDYTEDDIDLPNDENNLDVCNLNIKDDNNDIDMISPSTRTEAAVPTSGTRQVLTSVSSFTNPMTQQPAQHQQRKSSGTKRNTRNSTSLTRNGESRDHKRSRTRSNDVIEIFYLLLK